ncbi:glycosyltransferase family 2 protein [Thermanaerovibrio velox]|uniref:glycosyltransferase family 2 protein n=1 Tax=Thermanaerovibrio velox TaxID=108007 RepID=UPI0002F47905|nr:glycosyltransferase [Thermanaerovibrio velox]MCX7828755.1 glycosyltransferase family 2 protein [Thermanaerothrix sp.]
MWPPLNLQDSRAFVELLRFVPWVVFLELPYYLLVALGLIRYVMHKVHVPHKMPTGRPKVSCVITCYSEGEDVKKTIKSLAFQLYDGEIEIIPVIDGAVRNRDTYRAALEMEEMVKSLPGRTLRVLPKWQRGGRVSSLNAGLNAAEGAVVMALDGDTSFDNDMVLKAVRHFADPNVAALAGCLRVRNWRASPVAALQGLEYLLSILTAKTGLSQFNTVNNISGAFGVFRREILELVLGWDSGSAEDLDLTMRIKNYFGRNPGMRIVFDPEVMGHTDVPDTLRGFLKQRLRWDGDLFYIYVRKHLKSFSPSLMGWRNFLVTLVGGFYFQIITPLMLLVYTCFSFLTLSLGKVLYVFLWIYLFYLGVTVFFYLAAMLCLTERPRDDIRFLPLIPIFPAFTFMCRLWSAFAILWEIAAQGHRDSSMAPWWVLRRGKF